MKINAKVYKKLKYELQENKIYWKTTCVCNIGLVVKIVTNEVFISLFDFQNY